MIYLTKNGVSDHGLLSGLGDDDHTIYLLLLGRSGGQTLIGGTGSGDDLTLQSTSHATKGNLLFGTSGYDEVNNRLGVGTTSPEEVLDVQLGVSAGAKGVAASFGTTGGGNQAGSGTRLLFTFDTSSRFAGAIDLVANAADNTDIILSNRKAGAEAEAVRILSDGSVGLSETTPSKLLDLKNGAAGGDILCYDIYTHDGGVETSDERSKENILPTNLGLDFIAKLNPIKYKWKDVPATLEEITEVRQKTVLIEKEVTGIEIVKIDGKYVQKTVTKLKTVDELVFEEVPLYDESGTIIGTHKIPVMEEAVKVREVYAEENYTRTHHGMVAQDVAQVLSDMGIPTKDFAGYVYEEDRDKYGLRYVEFIAPLIKAVQELKAEIDILKKV